MKHIKEATYPFGKLFQACFDAIDVRVRLFVDFHSVLLRLLPCWLRAAERYALCHNGLTEIRSKARRTVAEPRSSQLVQQLVEAAALTDVSEFLLALCCGSEEEEEEAVGEAAWHSGAIAGRGAAGEMSGPLATAPAAVTASEYDSAGAPGDEVRRMVTNPLSSHVLEACIQRLLWAMLVGETERTREREREGGEAGEGEGEGGREAEGDSPQYQWLDSAVRATDKLCEVRREGEQY